MNNSRTYEKVVKVSATGKQLALRISAILIYMILATVLLLVALNNLNFFVFIVILGGLFIFTVIRITWKYLQLEYEYSFSYGELTVAKIYGKRKRRQIMTTDIKTLTMIAPATKENIAKAEHFRPDACIYAVSHDGAEDIWLILTGDEDKKRFLLFFEADERSLDILKSSNMIAFSKKA